MDANGTHFHLLLGYDNWASCTADDGQTTLGQIWESSSVDDNTTGLAWDGERFELTLQPRLFRFVTKDNPLPLSRRRGAARDRYGNWYWIADSGLEILVNSIGTGNTSHFWSAGDGIACEPAKHLQGTPSHGGFQARDVVPSPTLIPLSGLVVTDDHYLVVGTLEPAGLLIFDLHAGGPPRQLLWPPEVPFVPFDMAPMPGGGVWILDREHARYWALDRYFTVIAQDQQELQLASEQLDAFQPVDGSSVRRAAARTFPGGIALSAASPLGVSDPIAIEALPDCTVLILDRNPGALFSLVYRYRFGEPLGQPVSTEVMSALIDQETRGDFRLSGYDFAFVPEHDETEGTIPDRLYIVEQNGDQTYAFSISQQNDQLKLDPVDEYLPMRCFEGKGLVTANTQTYYDVADQWIPLIEQLRPRYVSEATLYTPREAAPYAFDGRTPDCVWHRLMLDACIPHDTQVQVWSRAANYQGDLAAAEWQQEPHLYLRGDGSELPFVRGTTTEGSGTWELLFQNARGRYLQLQIKLSGNERSTPHLRALRIYYPRFSYLEHYLPAVYREDSQSASFLDRFLANLEGFYTTLEDKVAALQILFDIYSTPPEALAWLASWFGVVLDFAWDERKQRLFIKHAMDFFQYRGTICGLQMALRLALEDCPGGPDETIFSACSAKLPRANSIRIVERYLTRSTPGVVFGDPTDISGLRIISQDARWLPTQGGAELRRRYTNFIQPPGLAPGQVIDFPIVAPDDAAINADWQQFALDTVGFIPPSPAADPQLWHDFLVAHPEDAASNALWQQFARNTLGFIPAATSADPTLWQDFLARRYRRIDALNAVYQTTVTSFDQVLLFDHLPPDGAQLLDWYQFEAVVLAMHRTAHQFVVLLPTPNTLDVSEHQRRFDLAKRIVNLEKPAHTIFTVKFYWALFRVGEARLGEDTLIDRGSRTPQFLSPMVLGQGYIAESYLAPGHPQNVADRLILGRDRL